MTGFWICLCFLSKKFKGYEKGNNFDILLLRHFYCILLFFVTFCNYQHIQEKKTIEMRQSIYHLLTSFVFSQKPPELFFFKKVVHKNFAKFPGKHLCQSLFFNKVAGETPSTLLKKKTWHRCFPINFAKHPFQWTPWATASDIHLRYYIVLRPCKFLKC